MKHRSLAITFFLLSACNSRIDAPIHSETEITHETLASLELPIASQIVLDTQSEIPHYKCIEITATPRDAQGKDARLTSAVNISLKDAKGEVIPLFLSRRCAVSDPSDLEIKFTPDLSEVKFGIIVNNPGPLTVASSPDKIPTTFKNPVMCVVDKKIIFKLEFITLPTQLDDIASFSVGIVAQDTQTHLIANYSAPIELFYEDILTQSKVSLGIGKFSNGRVWFSSIPAIRFPEKRIKLIAQSSNFSVESKPYEIKRNRNQALSKSGTTKSILIKLNGKNSQLRYISSQQATLDGRPIKIELLSPEKIRIEGKVYQIKVENNQAELTPVY